MSRSVRIHEFGGPEVLKIEDVTVPEPGAGEVRLRIRGHRHIKFERSMPNGGS